ncbi:hypothetical protein TB2_018852 [Malus domestica]
MSCCLSCYAVSTCDMCGSVASGISSKSARLAYCSLFELSLIVSWILKEVGAPLLEKIPWISSSETHTKEWYQTEAVLRHYNVLLVMLQSRWVIFNNPLGQRE